MKVKEIDRTANIAWSPAAQHPIYIAAGTAAQQLDATFSTTAALEIYGLNLSEPGFDMELKGSVVSDYRFHNVQWGCYGMKTGKNASGVIVGGADGGNIMVYNPEDILANKQSLMIKTDKHTGPVRSLDFNTHQPNLLASGGSDSEIFIWDLANPTNPMTPGSKSQPLEDVTCVAWNCQVQHILASTFVGRCIVWDLRKNEPIIKVNDSTSRMRCKEIAWNPAVATQLCIASEDDQSPVIQMWDLRFATSPLKVLEKHQRGVMSMAWCKQDPDLLVSCGKDTRILCWNPNSNIPGGEVVCELETGNQWSFNVAWCERNPAVIASSSFDGHIGVYSLMGGQQQAQPSSKITDAFAGSDSYLQAPVNQMTQRTTSMPLKKPPKWLRKPVGATFAFGGKLVTFNSKPDETTKVTINQVRTDDNLSARSMKLESTLSSGQFQEFCNSKVSSAASDYEKTIWSFLSANFESNPKLRALSLLGYNTAELSKKIQDILNVSDMSSSGVDAEELANRMNSLSAGKSQSSQQSTPSLLGSQTPETSRDMSRDAFDLIADSKSTADSPITVGFPIPVDNGVNGMITKAILVGDIEAAVNLCLMEDRMADALVLAMAAGGALLQKTQQKYLKKSDHDISKLISAVVMNNWKQLIINCDITYWKEALAAILTYSKQEEFCELCEILGKRLQSERNGEYFKNAAICYICSGNLESFVDCYTKQNPNSSPSNLQELMEQLLILEKCVQMTNVRPAAGIRNGPLVASKLSSYAQLLATQGDLVAAFQYLRESTDMEAAVLKDRIYQGISHQLPGVQQPNFPFRRTSIQASTMPASRPMAAPARNQWSTVHPPSSGQMYQPNTFTPPQNSGFSNSAGLYNPNQAFAPAQPSPIQTNAPVSTFQPPPLPTQNYISNAPTPPPSSGAVQSQKSGLSQRYPAMAPDPNVYSPNQMSYPSFSQGYMQPAPMPSANLNQSNAGVPPTSQFNPNIYNPNNAVNNEIAPPQQQQQQQPSEPPLYPAAMTELKQGWNDPPTLKSASGNKPKRNVDTMSAITQPIFNPNQAQEMAPSYASNNNYGPPGGNMQQQYNYAANQMTDNIFAPNNEMQRPQKIEEVAAAPVEPPVKAAIPPEYQIMQDVFENLRLQCSNVVTNPQMRRKLDDVARKLENLYDKLRSSSLTENTIAFLHQMVQAVQQHNYAAAIAAHSSLINSGDFSEISNFMPGLKVLFQMSMQLLAHS